MIQIDALQEAIEGMHGGVATYNEAVYVSESFGGRPVWEGDVYVFDLEDHPKAKKCYAWSSPVEGSDKRLFYAVLEIPPVASAVDAVRAAIVSDYRGD